MNPTTHATEGNAPAPVLYRALERCRWQLRFERLRPFAARAVGIQLPSRSRNDFV